VFIYSGSFFKQENEEEYIPQRILQKFEYKTPRYMTPPSVSQHQSVAISLHTAYSPTLY
jgi:hypothetical protein